MMKPHMALGATLHDPVGRLAEAIDRLGPVLHSIFPSIAINVSDATRLDVLAAAQRLGAKVMVHEAGEAIIGKARRDAIALAGAGKWVLYADFDHLLRWAEFGSEDLQRVLTYLPEVDFLVIGRSAAALANEPRRLRESEALVNHVYGLLTGNYWDLMFAIRRLSPVAARLIVEQSEVDTLANDVEWPLLARQAGLSLDYAESDALFYRTIEEFGAAEDGGDHDPLQWIKRIEFAALHAEVMRRFLPDVRDVPVCASDVS